MGKWFGLIVNLGRGNVAITLNLEQEGDRLRGSIQGPLGSGEIANASVNPTGEVQFTVPVTVEGQTMEASFGGTITGNEMKGVVNIVGRAPGSFTGTRPGPSGRGTGETTPPG